ncbi:MAG: sigma 54-interacting transcriptional regulator [Chloroflexota bacterium]|nr:sigma 54-interacting transcriptional regulator [Chloroflexota bacterium]MDQ5867410.1 sigma 54-interacting transcriptional regulator [Chloroflexota bacterium]
MPKTPARPRTLGELRGSEYQSLPVKEEMRKNLIRKLRDNQPIFPGIIGYEDTVIPQIENAILSGQDIIFLGERGQAKTRLARALINLLDEEIPVIKGSEINDDPYNPISAEGKRLVAEHEDLTEIDWLRREDRYGEKLATPDITIADLIGDVDPIKVAEGRYLSDELTIHYGLLPRTNRGVFCINELPDLAERVQVGLLNVLEERDVQIRGYKVRLPLDVYLVASANPEDYTNRGRIITPLKDRAGSQIKTHYPTTLDHEIDIMEQERMTFNTPGYEVEVPQYMKEIVAEMTHLARRHPDISQRSGVSVRVSIANFENLVSNALKRAIKLNEHQVVPRVSDMSALASSTAGKIELESVGDVREEKVVEKLVQGAVLAAWNRRFSVGDFDDVVTRFHNGLVIEVSDTLPSMEYVHQASDLKGIRTALAKLEVGSNPSAIAAAVEFILEGLHLNRRLNKDRSAEGTRYRR